MENQGENLDKCFKTLSNNNLYRFCQLTVGPITFVTEYERDKSIFFCGKVGQWDRAESWNSCCFFYCSLGSKPYQNIRKTVDVQTLM